MAFNDSSRFSAASGGDLPYVVMQVTLKEKFFGTGSGNLTDLAKRAKALNLDAIHDTVHEMARDEARHGKALKGLLERYFG